MKNHKLKYLMCPPTYFNIDYVINPWMENQLHKTDTSLAIDQWKNLHNTLSQYATVELLSPKKKLPDLVFTANAGSTHKRIFIPSQFKCLERQPEQSIYRHWFASQGYEIKNMPDHVFFEGDGDVLKQSGSNTMWMGHGFRSDKESIAYLKKYFDLNVMGLELCDPRFYHLDTCFCPLLNNDVMYYPKAFSREGNDVIKNSFDKKNRIILSEQDALNFAGNAILIPTDKDKGVIILNKASNALKKECHARGYDVIEVDVSEFMRAGGATRCLVLRLCEER